MAVAGNSLSLCNSECPGRVNSPRSFLVLNVMHNSMIATMSIFLFIARMPNSSVLSRKFLTFT